MRFIGQISCSRIFRTSGPAPAIGLMALSLVMLSACTPNIESYGNMADQEAVKEIVAGTTTRKQVLELLGTPSTTSVFGSENWYYVGERQSWVAFLDPKVQERNVLIVRFDKNGVVSAVETRDKNDGRQIQIIGRETPVRGKELTILQQLLGNLGRVGNAPPGQ